MLSFYIPVLWLFYPASKAIAQFTEIVFRLSIDCDHCTLFYSVIAFYTILSFLRSLLFPSWSCQFTLTCIWSPFIICQIYLVTFDLLYPLLPLSCVVVCYTPIRCLDTFLCKQFVIRYHDKETPILHYHNLLTICIC